jgi:hypothetical protein
MVQGRSYYNKIDQICRSSGWVLGTDLGEMVIGVPQADGSQQSVVINDFQDPSGQAAIRIWSAVAPIAKVPVDQAMTVNFQLPAGCLAVNPELQQVVICATRIVNYTDQAELSTLLSTVAHFAAFYAKHYA